MGVRGLRLGALSAVLAMSIASGTAAARQPAFRDAVPTHPLWDRPADLGSRDLFNGPWGPEHAPDPRATYTFISRKHHGTNPGVVVRDPLGRTWHVKQAPHTDQGDEGPVEVVLSRVLSAAGYHQPPVYFLPAFRMTDARGTHLEPGGRFRLDEPSLHARGTWAWEKNPFIDTTPYRGLLVILLVFNSWDLKDSNNTLYDVQQNGGVDQWYVVRDLGGALGESGHLRPKRNNIEKFERYSFITGVKDGVVEFAFNGKQSNLIRHRITVEDMQWACNLLGGLSNRQWHDAFRAAGYLPSESARFIQKLQANIVQGQRLADVAWQSKQGRR
jgi:hypothetical protein